MKKIISAGLTLVAIVGLMLSPLAPYQVNAAMEDKMMTQKLTKTNLPVTLPLIKGFVNGFEVFYISTEASNEDVADHLTKLTGARVAFTPTLTRAPPESLANIYEFTNGIAGSGPQGFQPNVADSQPGDAKYSPLWRINLVTWKEGVTPRVLKSEADILSAQLAKELTITSTNIVVNCPFVKWNGGELQIRSNKTLTDETQYGGGQVLDIDTQKMTVTFVAHRGFAPDGKTIYYIATDASVKEVANDLGVVFVEKTGATLSTAAASDLFVFTNGIKGTGPLGFQASIASTNVGDSFYSPLWRILAATWKDASTAQFFTTQAEITSAGTNGKLTTDIAGVVVNCPFVEAGEDTMKDKMMGDKMMGDKMMEDKMMEDKMMDKMMKPLYMEGALTAAKADKPYGGDEVGNYKVRVKDNNQVTIIAKVSKYMMMKDQMMEDAMMQDKMGDKMIEDKMMDEKVLEGWLVDMESGYKLSTGQLSKQHTLVFAQRMVNPWIYDLIVVTEEPVNDTDPSPHTPIAGTQLAEPFGQ